jgi:spore germination protein GerM
MVGVYLSCKADFALVGTPQQPVYLALREIPFSLTGSQEERLEGAVRAYIAGPRPEELSRGYFSAAPPSLADALESVSISGGSATIEFSTKVEGRMGNLGNSTVTEVFLVELAATAFQFEGVDELTLQVEGDCERLWNLMERTCTVIKR